MKVLVTRKIHQDAIRLLEQNCEEIQVWPNPEPIDSHSLAKMAKHCDGILTMLSDFIGKALLENCPNLKIVSNYAVGVDNIDIEYCKASGIRVGHTPNVLTHATAELAFALLLSCSRRISESHHSIRQGQWQTWQPDGMLGMDLQGKTLGVIGLGRIGAEFARMCKNFYNMDILYCNRTLSDHAGPMNAKKVELDELCHKSDVVSLHCALTNETKGIMNKERFQQMKKTAIFINTARGLMHHEQDLIWALKNNIIWGAGLDVTNPEPMQAHNELLSLPRVAISPHIGSATIETRKNMAVMAANNILNTFKGLEAAPGLLF